MIWFAADNRCRCMIAFLLTHVLQPFPPPDELDFIWQSGLQTIKTETNIFLGQKKNILVIAELKWGGRGWEIADRHKAIKGWQWQRQTLEIESSLTVLPHMTTCSSQMLFKTIPIYLELHKWKITNKTNFTKMNKLKSAEEDEIPSWGSWWTAALVCRRYNWR